MRTLVYEPRVGGHFLNLAALVADALAEAGAESHVAVAKNAPGSLEFENSLARLEGKVHVHAILSLEERRGALALAKKSYRALANAVTAISPARTYLPTADGLVQVMAMAKALGFDDVLRRTHVEGLLMNGSVGHPELLSKPEHLRRRVAHAAAKRGCHTAFHLNPFVRDWERDSGLRPSSWVQTMPDPVEVPELSRDTARRALGLPLGERIVGMVGRLDERKGAHILIQAFERAILSERDRLLLFGPCAPEVRPALERLLQHPRLGARVYFRDQVLTNDDFFAAIAAMDLLALPYTSVIGSSSIVIRAAAAGRPVITTGGGWSERIFSRFPLGWTFGGPDPVQLAAILGDCLERAASWQPTPSVARFVAYNSPENFAAHWTHGFRNASGLPADPRRITWDALLARESEAPQGELG